MLELHPYLKRVYEDDIVDCMMCHTIAIKVRTLSCSGQQYYINFEKCKVGRFGLSLHFVVAWEFSNGVSDGHLISPSPYNLSS